jgi:Flp pilus assembly protein TadD
MRGCSRFALLFVLSLLPAAGCSAPKPPAPEPAAAAKARAQALIESGSAAFRAGDFSAAAKRYASAVVVSPEDPAAFYGLGMALAKLGRDDEARVAYAKARELSRGEMGDNEDMPHEIKYRRTVHP